MKYVITIEKVEGLLEVSTENEEGIPIDGIFGMPVDITRDFARDQVRKVIDFLNSDGQ